MHGLPRRDAHHRAAAQGSIEAVHGSIGGTIEDARCRRVCSWPVHRLVHGVGPPRRPPYGPKITGDFVHRSVHGVIEPTTDRPNRPTSMCLEFFLLQLIVLLYNGQVNEGESDRRRGCLRVVSTARCLGVPSSCRDGFDVLYGCSTPPAAGARKLIDIRGHRGARHAGDHPDHAHRHLQRRLVGAVPPVPRPGAMPPPEELRVRPGHADRPRTQPSPATYSGECRLGLGRDVFNGCSSLCQYIVEYGHGSNSTGTYSSDKLTLTPAYAVDGFRFGCSHADQLFGPRPAKAAFSYCLPLAATHSGWPAS